MKNHVMLCAAITASLIAAKAEAQADVNQVGATESTPVQGAEAVAEVIPVANEKDRVAESESKQPLKRVVIDEIIVTAQKREENLQDVPISIAAFSGEQLTDMGVSQPTDLSRITPGMQMTEAVGFSVSYLRGVGADGFLMADPSVATYVDGVYLPIAMGVEQKFGVLERIEVLKGPQGTLFGRNAVGGAINVVTKKPSLDNLEVRLSQEAGDYNKLTSTAYVNIPVGDKVALAVSGLLDSRDSYYDSVESVGLSNLAGRPVRDENSRGAKARILIQPLDWTTITLNASYVYDEGAKGLYSPNVDPSPLGFAIGIRAQPGFDGARTSDPALLRAQSQIYSFESVSEFDPFDVKFMGSKQRFRARNAIDIDGSQVHVAGFELKNYFGDIKTAEVQVLSNNTSWLSDRLTWVAGLYYFDSDQGVDPSDLFAGSIDLSAGQILGITLPEDLMSAIRSAIGPLDAVLPNGKIIFNGILRTESYSAYSQATYAFNDWLSLTLGLRYQNEERTVLASGSYLETFDGGMGVQYLDAARNVEPITSVKLAPKATLELRPVLDWLPGQDWLLYATWQEAEKAGLYNVINVLDTTADRIEPEEMTAYEVGFKSLFFDGAVRASGAVFLYQQKNVQIQYFSLLAGGAIQFQNAKAAEVKGAEIDLAARPIDGMTLNLGVAYLDAVFTDFPDGKGYSENLSIFTQNQDFSGNRVPRSPEYTVRTGIAQMFPVFDNNFEVALDYYYNSGYYTMAANTSKNKQKPYDLLNGRVTWEYEPWSARITGFVQNIADERYSIAKFDTDFGSIASLAAPRTYGVRIEWSLK